MHDVLDIIRNVQSLYAVGPTLDVLKDYERVLDELDVYVFKNWEDGELLEGPKDERHFTTCSFMWPADKMPDPAGGKNFTLQAVGSFMFQLLNMCDISISICCS